MIDVTRCRPSPSRLIVRLALVPLLATGLAACSASDDDEGPRSPSGPSGPPAPDAPVHYTVIGASEAAGVGSSAPCLPFVSCPNGAGYVPRVVRELESGGADVTLTNMGIPGAVMSPEVESVGQSVGIDIPSNFLQQQVPFVPPQTTLVTVFAGGNDTNTLATAIDRDAAGTGNPDAYIDQHVRAFAADYVRLIEGVRGRAPDARIVVLNLPNLAGLPYAARRARTERLWMQRLAVGFSRAANALSRMNVTVIDLMCDARAYRASIYSADGFHPNDAGYAFMAAEVVDAVRNGGAPPPADNCPQMTLVPR